MAEYISKEDAIDFLNSKQLSLDSWGATEEAIGVIDARLIIKDMKPEDVAPVVHAKWVKKYQYGNDYCSACNYENCGYGYPKFCPNCGAKMDKEEE